MKKKEFSLQFFIPLLVLGIILFFAGCQDEMVVEPQDSEPTTDQAAMEKLVDQDSSLTSFEANYNEDGLMDILGKIQENIYPFRVGHKMRLVNRNLNINFVNDSMATGTLTKTFEGVLFIAASYDSNSVLPDTVIEKPFTSVVTRNLIFRKIANTDHPFRNWIIAAISLPEGGTQSPNIDIIRVTVFLPSGDTLVVDSPNEYYLRLHWGWWRHIPFLRCGESVTVRVELFSAYEEDDFVTLTYGANRYGHHRAKRRFELVSSTAVAGGFEKVYEQTYTTNQYPGHYHAVINAMPKQVIYDDSTPVEMESWGIPYFVHF
jgi:hypothetical protein